MTPNIEPLVNALIQAVKRERDLFNEASDDYSTEALLLAKERVALCKAALLDAKDPPEASGSHFADDEGIVCVLASHLAKSDGHDDPNHLIWEGGPIPEPWGEVWCRYEEPAKEILRLVDGCLTPKGCTPVEPGEGWISVTDRLPVWTDDGRKFVLAYSDTHDWGGTQFAVMRQADFHALDIEGDGEPGTYDARVVTHWKELRAPQTKLASPNSD